MRYRIANFGLRIVEGGPTAVASVGGMSAGMKWLASAVLGALAVGWLSAKIHASGHAPVGLTSFGVGALLGVIASALAASQRFADTRTLIFGTLLLAAVTVLSEHAWLYRDYRGQWQEARAKSAAVAMFRDEVPPSPGVYFAHEWQPVLWITDAALIVVTSLCVVVFGRRAVSNNAAAQEAPIAPIPSP